MSGLLLGAEACGAGREADAGLLADAGVAAGIGARASCFSLGTSAYGGDTGDTVVLGSSSGRSDWSSLSSHRAVSVCSSQRKVPHLRAGPNVVRTDPLDYTEMHFGHS